MSFESISSHLKMKKITKELVIMLLNIIYSLNSFQIIPHVLIIY
jgi:hypothetical protein